MKNIDDITIKTSLQSNDKNGQYIRDKLYQFNIDQIGQDIKYSIYAYDIDKLVGGILVSEEKTSIFIDILWVDDAYRQCGIGSKLVDAAEQNAIKKNILYSTTDTFEFQAVNFYLKNGYSEIGRIPKYIEGHDKIYFRKKLILSKGD